MYRGALTQKFPALRPCDSVAECRSGKRAFERRAIRRIAVGGQDEIDGQVEQREELSGEGFAQHSTSRARIVQTGSFASRLGLNSLQCPSEMISTASPTILMAVSSSIAYAGF